MGGPGAGGAASASVAKPAIMVAAAAPGHATGAALVAATLLVCTLVQGSALAVSLAPVQTQQRLTSFWQRQTLAETSSRPSLGANFRWTIMPMWWSNDDPTNASLAIDVTTAGQQQVLSEVSQCYVDMVRVWMGHGGDSEPSQLEV